LQGRLSFSRLSSRWPSSSVPSGGVRSELIAWCNAVSPLQVKAGPPTRSPPPCRRTRRHRTAAPRRPGRRSA
jgi:hypothetical protein